MSRAAFGDHGERDAAPDAGDLTPGDQVRHGLRAPALDGLRAVACLMVLAHHCGRDHAASWGARLYNRGSAAGWAGVDLFFVLSGFLITSLLFDMRGRIGALRSFWSRRAVRILPLSYAYLGVVLFSPLWRDEPWHAGIYREQWWFWLYVNNWLALYRPSLDHGVLAHFWSLAIEEQFYLIWPLVVLSLPPSRVRALCVGLSVASVAGHVSAVTLHVTTDLIHSLTPARLDGLLLGSWLALFMRRERPSPWPAASHRWLLAAAAALAVVLAAPARGLPAGHRWVLAVGSPALAVIFTLLLCALLIAPRDALVRRVSEAPALVALGRVSYGFYVLHLPVVASLRRHWPAADGSLRDCVAFFGVALLSATALAAISWFVLERPLLRLRPYP